MNKQRFKRVGDLSYGTFVKCFGLKCFVHSYVDGLCRLVSKNDVFNVPFNTIVELIKSKRYEK